MHQAEVWLKDGRLDQAAAFFEGAASAFEKTARFDLACRCSYLAAECSLDLSRFDKADIFSSKAVTLISKFDNRDYVAAAHLGRGKVLVTLSRYEESVKHFEKGLALNPSPYQGWVLYGIALDELGRSTEALAKFEVAIRERPFDSVALFHKAVCLQKASRLDEAVEYYCQAISLSPEDADIRNNFASALRKLKRYREAEDQLRKAIELDPKHDGAWYNLASLLTLLHRYPDALPCWEKAVFLDPNDKSALTQLHAVELACKLNERR
jgi:tetratricopeptide (TPR) repeat protein